MGQPVKLFDPGESQDFRNTIYRVTMMAGGGLIRRSKDVPGDQVLTDFFGRAGCEQSRGLVLGMTNHGESIDAMLRVLSEHKEKLASLKGLFISDIISDENEISWIEATDVSQVLKDIPGLEELRLRSAHWFTAVRHLCLRSLIIESGGMGKECLEGIVSSVFPELEHLELWLGTSEYGAECTIDDLKPLLERDRFPRLRSLGLRNSEIADEIAKAVVDAPVLEQLESLDLSMGTLSNAGGECLMESERIAGLKKLDLHHHFMSDDLMARFEQWGPSQGLDLKVDRDNADFEEGEDGYRFVAVGE